MSQPPDGPARLAGLLAELLALTPPPPSDDADPAEVLEVATEVLTSTAPKLATLRSLVDNHGTVPDVSDQVRELRDRTEAWMAAIERARAETLEALAAVARANRLNHP